MSKAETSFRIDQYREMESPLDRVRQAHEQPATPPVERQPEVRDSDLAKLRPDGPAYRSQVDVPRQHTENRVAAQYAMPEVFGRRRDGSRVAVEASEAPGDFVPPSRQSRGVRVRGRRQARPGRDEAPAASGAEAPWVCREKRYAEAVATVEEIGRQAYLNPPTRARAPATAATPAAAGEVASTRGADEAQAGREPAWVRDIEQYAPCREEVRSGNGQEVADADWDADRQVTRTFHGPDRG